AKSVKRRIESLHTFREHRFYRGLVWTGLFYGLALLMVACVEPWEGSRNADPIKAMENIKTITTRFTSHQSDTQDKDDRVIAVAYYHPNGAIDRVDQHMTYPYNYKNPFRREFWAAPDPINVPLVMDGLELGNAENNILYGNDWPLKYISLVKKKHPRLHGMGELFDYDVNVEKGNNGLPLRILTKEKGLNQNVMGLYLNGKRVPKSLFQGYEELFEYEGDRLTKYSGTYVIDEDSEFAVERSKIYGSGPSWEDILYAYEGEKLSKVSYRGKDYQFYYSDDLLQRVEYRINETMYNYREHFYNSDGLRTRTDIYNVDQQLEFTIDYDYEFYEDE
ncbi:MAG: hypothetical protein RIE59_21920, partial [Imperialibacter sp.]